LNDWFEWNGVKCTDLGIHVSEHPPITVPEPRITFTEVPGRPGSLTTVEDIDVYEDMVLPVTCFIENTARINEIAGYLKGAGKVVFANRRDGFYYARIVNQIPFEQILRGRPNRTFTVNFRCKPFLYLHDSSPFTLTDSIGVIANPGTVYSEPIITVNGTGDVTIMINGEILELTDLSGSITMDSELREAYSGNESANSHMDGEFIRLLAGNNAYSWDGDVTSIQITPNWRTL